MRRSDRRRYQRRGAFLAIALAATMVSGAQLLERRDPDASPTAAQTSSPSPSASALPSPTPTARATASASPRPARKPVLLRVPIMRQLPQLPNGCEVTSLAMLLTAAGIPTDKMTLAREQKTDRRQPVFEKGAQGDLSRIRSWGDPNQAFVGNVYGRYGYGIYHGPLSKLLTAKAGSRGRDLTGQDFESLLDVIDNGSAVMIWATTTLRPTSQWVTWRGPRGIVRATFREHAVVLVGHSPGRLVVKNPLTGRRQTVPAKPLIAAWRQLGGQAFAVLPRPRAQIGVV